LTEHSVPDFNCKDKRWSLIGQFLLAFREALEAELVIAIMLAYLKRTERNSLSRYAWYGVYIAVGASLLSGASIWFLYGNLSGPAKALFEGIAALFAVLVLSSMIYWMASKGKQLRTEVESRVQTIVTQTITGRVSFSFVAVFREGLETVLFIIPFLLEDAAGTVVGSFLGIAASMVLAYVVFIAGMKIDIRKFFYFTSVLLVLLAGGLAGYGVHELIEYSEEAGIEVGWLGGYAYVLDIPKESPLHHKGVLGSILAVMFGYTIEAEWARIIVHSAYLAVSLPLVILAYQKRVTQIK